MEILLVGQLLSKEHLLLFLGVLENSDASSISQLIPVSERIDDSVMFPDAADETMHHLGVPRQPMFDRSAADHEGVPGRLLELEMPNGIDDEALAATCFVLPTQDDLDLDLVDIREVLVDGSIDKTPDGRMILFRHWCDGEAGLGDQDADGCRKPHTTILVRLEVSKGLLDSGNGLPGFSSGHAPSGVLLVDLLVAILRQSLDA